jgi:hypothetical protein
MIGKRSPTMRTARTAATTQELSRRQTGLNRGRKDKGREMDTHVTAFMHFDL